MTITLPGYRGPTIQLQEQVGRVYTAWTAGLLSYREYRFLLDLAAAENAWQLRLARWNRQIDALR